MRILTATNIEKSIGEKQLFKGLSFSIGEKERIGLIGINGTGKSTLLKILSGEEEADKGDFTKPNDYTISFLKQDPDYNGENSVLDQVLSSENKLSQIARNYEKALAKLNEKPNDEQIQQQFFYWQKEMDSQNAWDVSTKAKTYLTKLGITDYHQQISSLSGGQKKRVALAEVLMDDADLLLLDEPTNHLDFEMIEWLQEELRKYPKSILFVTHDRYFLDNVSNNIFELYNGELFKYKGNYSAYLEAKAMREEEVQAQREKAENLFRRELAWIRRGAQARSTKQKARIQRFNELDQKLQNHSTNDSLEMSIGATRLGKDVVEIKDAFKSFDNKIILKDFQLLVTQNMRIGIVGKNGSGKSTLLNIIAGRENLDSGILRIGQTVKMAYYTQESTDMDVNKRMIEYIRESKDSIRTNDGQYISAAQLLERFLFPMHTHGTLIRKLSGGERRRLYLLKLLMDEPNVLLLDEPTNDLDTETLTILEDFLDDYPGVVITVSHDRYFLDKTCETLLVFKGEGIIEKYVGMYSDYLKTASEMVVKSKQEKDVKVHSETIVKQEKKKMTYKEKLEWETIDEQISEIEDKLASVQAEMAKAGSDFSRLQELMADEEKYNQRLEELIDRWSYLSEIAES